MKIGTKSLLFGAHQLLHPLFVAAAWWKIYGFRRVICRRQGNSSTFQTGYGYGLWHGAIAACGFSLEIAAVGRWRKAVLQGVPGDDEKARAVQLASNRVPGLQLIPDRGTKPHTGLAEAAGLALYGLVVLRGRHA